VGDHGFSSQHPAGVLQLAGAGLRANADRATGANRTWGSQMASTCSALPRSCCSGARTCFLIRRRQQPARICHGLGGAAGPIAQISEGGEATLIINQELRFQHSSGIGGAAFYDAGNVGQAFLTAARLLGQRGHSRERRRHTDAPPRF
jgi:hypothetical protein